MKLFLLCCITVVISTFRTMAQTHGPIPNSSFEHWHRVGSYDSLDGWTTNNSPGNNLVRPDSTTKLDSVYSMLLDTNGWAMSPMLSPAGWDFFFSYTATIAPDDTVTALAIIYRNGVAIDTNTWRTSIPMGSWHYYSGSVGIRSYPDSARIVFLGGKKAGTIFHVDRALFAIESVENISNKVQARISPNPINNSARFQFKNPENAPYRWLLIDATGRQVRCLKSIRSEVISFERNGLPAGIYTWELWSEKEGGRAAGKVILE